MWNPDSSLPAEWDEERARMVREQISARGIRDRRVLEAMSRIPRERFVPEDELSEAYADRALPIECNQTISQPYVVAHMTAWLELLGFERVLEIGTGSGYQSAVLSLLAREVYTVEWFPELSEQARRRHADLGITNIFYGVGDGAQGWPEAAPFDAILVTAGGPQIPWALQQQLAIGGRLVMPIGSTTEQNLIRVRRTEHGYTADNGMGVRFVRLRGAQGWAEKAE